MQTFLPYPDFADSARVLDTARLGKQRVEAMQLVKAVQRVESGDLSKGWGWVNHPAAIMWRGFVPALMEYHDACIEEWVRRGYRNNMVPFDVVADGYPVWIGSEPFHASHRSNLLRKAPEHYGRFGWTEASDLPYLWPGEQR